MCSVNDVSKTIFASCIVTFTTDASVSENRKIHNLLSRARFSVLNENKTGESKRITLGHGPIYFSRARAFKGVFIIISLDQ